LAPAPARAQGLTARRLSETPRGAVWPASSLQRAASSRPVVTCRSWPCARPAAYLHLTGTAGKLTMARRLLLLNFPGRNPNVAHHKRRPGLGLGIMVKR